jgi:small-conductance mechanosensitive channel
MRRMEFLEHSALHTQRHWLIFTMPSDYDATEFIDGDFLAHKTSYSGAPPGGAAALRAPTREEVDSKVAEAHNKLAEKKRELEELERERANLEETRRRQMEFQTGRQEMVHNLTRGLGLLQEAEFNARRDAEQMAKALVELRQALSKVEAIHEENWTKESFSVELTRGLTTLENARMEWNSARLKFPVLSGPLSEEGPSTPAAGASASVFATQSFGQLCRLGLAMTWPLAIVALLTLAALLVLLFRH